MLRSRGERVADRQRDDQLVLPEQVGDELIAQRVRIVRDERALEIVRAQRVQRVFLGVLDHMDRDAGVCGAELRQHREQVVRTGRVHAADPDLPAQQPGDVLELAVQSVDLGQHALGVAEHHAALGGELDPAARAVKHVHAELLFQPPDLLGDRRLREKELVTGLRQ